MLMLRFKLLFIGYYLIVFLFLGLVGLGIWKFSFYVQEHGLKSIVSAIWEGKSNDPKE